MATIPTVTLNNGITMPQLGFGVFQIPEDETYAAVSTALTEGYRSIDTAAIYGNEHGVGRAIADSGLNRDELFITTKLWIDDLGADTAGPALDVSLDRLGLDYVDLYLIHWPAPATDAYLRSWPALEAAVAGGKTRAIGVSNFLPAHLDRLAELGGTVPAVNQIELHPLLQNRETAAYDRDHGILTEAWSPLAQAAVLKDPAIVEIATRHEATAAQVVLRWHLQQGRIVIPKSVTPARIAENLDVLGFELSDDELAVIDGLEDGTRIGGHPDTFNG